MESHNKADRDRLSDRVKYDGKMEYLTVMGVHLTKILHQCSHKRHRTENPPLRYDILPK